MKDFCGISATLKLTENRLSRCELNLHNKLPNAVQLRPDITVLGTEKTRVCAEISLEPVSYCDLAQNLETVQFLISKDLDKPNDGSSIVNRERCTSLLLY